MGRWHPVRRHPLLQHPSTHAALQDSLDTSAVDRLVWRPDVYGSICFLSLQLPRLRLRQRCLPGWRRRDTKEWRIAVANLLGSIAFGVSAVAAYVIPSTGDVLALGAANFSTAIGALCFLLGAIILLPKASDRAVAVAQ